MTHEIKSEAEVFESRWRGLKPWEFRKDDRCYEVGNFIHEREIENGSFTGRHILSRVVYVLGEAGEKFGLPAGYCIMTLEMVAKGKWLPRIES